MRGDLQNYKWVSSSFTILILILISVYLLGGRRDIRVQFGKRDLIQRHLQLLRQDGPI